MAKAYIYSTGTRPHDFKVRDWLDEIPKIHRHVAYPEVPLHEILTQLIEADAFGTITEWVDTPSLCVGDLVFLWMNPNGEGIICYPVRISENGFEILPYDKVPFFFRGDRRLRLKAALTTPKLA